MSTAGLWEEPSDPEPRQPSLIRTFRSKPRITNMICWDGSAEAYRLIARYGGQHCSVSMERKGSGLEVYVKRWGRYADLEPGDWAVIDPDGVGVYPVPALQHGDLFDAVPEPPTSLWNDDTWEAPRGAEGALG